MKSFKEILTESAKLKIKYKEVIAFKTGLKTGAEDFIYGRSDTIATKMFGIDGLKKHISKSFDAGYKLGQSEKYKREYIKSGDSNKMLDFAVNSGDVIPVGWRTNMGGSNMLYIEEI